MKTFAIINGTTLYIRKCYDMKDAINWAFKHANHSLEVIVREIETIDNIVK
jgi:hypothetical protein